MIWLRTEELTASKIEVALLIKLCKQIRCGKQIQASVVKQVNRMRCPFYQDLRQKHLSNQFIENLNVHEFVMLLFSYNDTTFIHAWQKKKMLLTD